MKIDRKTLRIWSMVGSTGTFGLAVGELVKEYPELCIVTADLCKFSGLERFWQEHPQNLYNVGIAEQNMIGMAAGLACEGVTVFAATYASFLSTRALDQVRISMGYMKAPVKLVGLTAGFSAGILGATHMALEDVAILRSVPNMTILSPADCLEEMKCLEAAVAYPGPVYIRLTGTKRMPSVYREDYDFRIGKAVSLRQGQDVCILATGSMVSTAVKVAEEMEKSGISAAVYNIHTLKPIDRDLMGSLGMYRLVVTVEEHSVIGGLGGAVAEEISGLPVRPKLLRIGVEDYYPHAGPYSSLIADAGLSRDRIFQRITGSYEQILTSTPK